MDETIATDSLTRLTFILSELREQEPGGIGILSGWGGIACWNDCDVASALSAEGFLDRDTRLLLLGLLSKCGDIDDGAQELDPEVRVDGGPTVESYGIAWAHAGSSSRPPSVRAVVGVAHQGRVGLLPVECAGDEVDVVFVADFADERLMWRHVYEAEDVPEQRFFELSSRAFPGLLFAPTLSFGRFEGAYGALRSGVVGHLAALNDRWTSAYVLEAGNSERISSRIGINVSRESNSTRASDRLMRQRNVVYDGSEYRCEWHSKLEPHRNRIHFHPADDGLALPLIGIFCDHLDT